MVKTTMGYGTQLLRLFLVLLGLFFIIIALLYLTSDSSMWIPLVLGIILLLASWFAHGDGANGPDYSYDESAFDP
jgi:hypothetical protein